MKTITVQLVLLLAVAAACTFFVSHTGSAANPDPGKGRRILVVAGSHQGHRWSGGIVDALKRELTGADVTFFYLDAIQNLPKAKDKAAEAFGLYQELKPDAVVTIGDNAQTFFAAPYLKGMASTPVIFCGVKGDPSEYGFPAANVTGVLERELFGESISLARSIDPMINTIGILYKPGRQNKRNLARIEEEKQSYSASVAVTAAVESVADVRKAVSEHSAKVNAFLVLNMAGIVDDSGRRLNDREAISLIVQTADLPVIASSESDVEAGALCGADKSAEEQGVLAAQQLKAHWQGKPVRDLPVLRSREGRGYINLKTMTRFNLQLSPDLFMSADILSGN